MENFIHKIWISVGSNVPDAERKITIALQRLSELDFLLKSSSLYRTHALNRVDPDYINGVVSIQTVLGYEDINRRLKDIEISLGRSPESKKKGRVEIDLDIVVFDDKVIRDKDFLQDYFKKGYEELLNSEVSH